MNENTNELDCPAALDNPPAEALCGEESSADPGGAAEALAACPPDSASGAPADSDPAGVASDPGAVPGDPAELSELREELTRLREELSRKEEASFRLGRECAEFRELYPEVPLTSVPDDVWDAVRDGVPLPAAFALAERKRLLLDRTATESNRRNRSRSSGEVGQETPGYFSFEEVRRMTRDEVRENYSNILLSMQKWH